MKKFQFLLYLLVVVTCLRGQTISVPDPELLSYLKSTFPDAIDANDQLIPSQAASYTGSFNCSGKNIHNLEGLQYFTNVTRLDVSDNAISNCEQISSLIAVTKLNISNNNISSLPSLSSLTNLEMLIVSKNKLSALPSLQANVKLKEIIAFDNKLITFPSTAALQKLEKIDLGNNLLTATPDFSANLSLKFLSIDRNFLSQLPDISLLDSLTEVQFHLNYFTFSDFIPISSYPGFANNFTISPQRNIPHDSLILRSTDSLFLSTGVDENITGMQRTWYFKNAVLMTVEQDRTFLFPASKQYEGYYYALLSCSALSGLQLRTDSFWVGITACPSVNDIALEYEEINCLKAGKLKISLPSMPVESYAFILQPDGTPEKKISHTGVFEHLVQPVYHLRIEVGTNCKVDYDKPVRIPFVDCEEAFITPDGDGEKDVFYFDQEGTVVIYDKDGVKVSSFSLPAAWDGTTDKGKKVPPGYYVSSINEGKEMVRITVIY